MVIFSSINLYMRDSRAIQVTAMYNVDYFAINASILSTAGKY